MIKNTISKFLKAKKQTQKDPILFKRSQIYIRRPQIKNFKTDPIKSRNYDSKYSFKVFKNQKTKKDPLKFQKSKT